jgi:hypothetical protein
MYNGREKNSRPFSFFTRTLVSLSNQLQHMTARGGILLALTEGTTHWCHGRTILVVPLAIPIAATVLTRQDVDHGQP